MTRSSNPRQDKRRTRVKAVKKNRPDRDRRVRQNARIARVLSVLNLIQGRGRWNAKAIAEELECSERTVFRDLSVLEFSGVPWFFDEAEQCYRVRPDYKFPVLTLTDEEILGQAFATVATAAPGLNVTAGSAPTTRKLAAVSRKHVQELIDDALRVVSVLDLKLADHSRHHEAIKTVQWALVQRKQVTGIYESPYEARTVKLRLHPYRLSLIKNAWYIIGRLMDESVPKTFRVARFKSLRLIDEPAIVPADFDLRAYFGNAWAVYRGEKSFAVEIWFASDAAKIVTETNWHHTQTVTRNKDGSVRLKFHVDGLEEIANWILSWTGRCCLIAPTELRDLVMSKLRWGLSLHENGRP